jgi:FtsH-binding integral membrane protein
MYHLLTVYPPARRLGKLPLSRDQLMLLMMAVNEIFLGIDAFTAHSMSGTMQPYEWIPVIFGPCAGLALLLAGLVALRRRPLATLVGTLTLAASVVVGLLGDFLHLQRTVLPNALPGQQITVNLVVWAPPLLAPLVFCLVGLLGISAAWVEDPPDSGVLRLLGKGRLHLPYSKTQAYFFLIGLGCLATVVSSVLDHARTGFSNPWLWLPTAAGVFSTVAACALGAIERPTRSDLLTYAGAMLLMLAVGLIGFVLHVSFNLVDQGTVVVERFLRGAPFLAPLLYCNMGLLGLLVLLDPGEGQTSGAEPSVARADPDSAAEP